MKSAEDPRETASGHRLPLGTASAFASGNDRPVSADRTDVLIVGGGPVGLDLACRLVLAGLSVRVLEKRLEPTRHSRSIGIHPPALEVLAGIGVVDSLIAEGIQVASGLAHAGSKPIGRLAFERCPPPYRFVLAIEQWKTERILEARLRELAPGALRRGVEVTTLAQHEDGVSVETGDCTRYEADWLVGCDGKNSRVRDLIKLPFVGRAYDDPYIMGDFADNSGIGPRAAIFLTSGGLVESFPLPDAWRRWVVRTPLAIPGVDPAPDLVTALVIERTGFRPDPTTARMTSSFGVERRLAATMAHGRVLLAGDAAHVVSPIGGQGMNLGWLDAADAAPALVGAHQRECDAPALFRAYSNRRRLAADRAADRAEFNMWFGISSAIPALKFLAARLMLSPPLAGVFARRFTMRGI